MFVSTFELNGGLNHVIFLFLGLVFFLDAVFSWYCSSSLNPLCFRVDSCTCFVSRKDVLSLDRLLSRFETISGMLLGMLFGWLDIKR